MFHAANFKPSVGALVFWVRRKMVRVVRFAILGVVILFVGSFLLATFGNLVLWTRKPAQPLSSSASGLNCAEPNTYRKPLDRIDADIVLALSGGGYRATMYHVGALRRMNELGLLSKVKVVSSVSGGSILAGVLAQNWHKLHFNPENGVARCLDEVIAKPLNRFTSIAIDIPVFLSTLPSSFRFLPLLQRADWLPLPGNRLAEVYKELSLWRCRSCRDRADGKRLQYR